MGQTYWRRQQAPLQFDVARPQDWTPTAEVTPGPLNPEQWLNWLKRKWNTGMQAGANDPMAAAVGMVNPFASGVGATLGRIRPPVAKRTQVARRTQGAQRPWNPAFTAETNVLPPAAVANRSLVVQPADSPVVRRRWRPGDPSLLASHGTPFPAFPAFNLAHAGHGQGAASQGWGMYMGEAPGTARSYQTMHRDDPIHIVRSAMYEAKGDPTQARTLLLEALTNATTGRVANLVPYGTPGEPKSFWEPSKGTNPLQDPEQLQHALELMDTGADVRGIAQVQINILPEQLVDLDRTLTAQSPQVQQALGELLSRLGFSHDQLKQSFLEAETHIQRQTSRYTYIEPEINPLQLLPEDPALWPDPKPPQKTPSHLEGQAARFISGATYGWPSPAQDPEPLMQMTAELGKLDDAMGMRRRELTERNAQSKWGEALTVASNDPQLGSWRRQKGELEVVLKKAIWDHVAAAFETAPPGRFTLNPAATAYTMGKGLTGRFGPQREFPYDWGIPGRWTPRTRPDPKTQRRQARGGDVSQALQAEGVSGNRYFDAFSRPEGEGTRNYVIWDVTQAKILRWVLGAVGAVGAGESMNQQRRVPSARVY